MLPGMRWVVFDYGEVIGLRTGNLPELAAMLGVATEPFEAAYWANRDAYDRGCGDLEYWQAIGDRVGVAVDGERAAALTEADIAGWLHVDDDALALLDDLSRAGADAGFGLALLSNAASTHGRAFERQPWAAYFQHIVISGDLKCAKPDPEIWRALVEQLTAPGDGFPPDEVLFLDDKQANVDGARAAGLRAQRWTGAAAARAHLTALGVL